MADYSVMNDAILAAHAAWAYRYGFYDDMAEAFTELRRRNKTGEFEDSEEGARLREILNKGGQTT